MSDPYVHKVGAPVTDIDDVAVQLGVDYDTVTISRGTWVGIRLNADQSDEFAACFVRACWEAGANARQIALGELERGDG